MKLFRHRFSSVSSSHQSAQNELGPMGERRRKTRLKTWPEPDRTILSPGRIMAPSRRRTSSTLTVCSAPFFSSSSSSVPLTTSLLLSPLISISLLLIASTCCTLLCNANEDTSRFALRPFQASPQPLTRRQDAGHLHPIPVLDLPPVSRHEPNLVPILTAPVPRGSVGPKPSFQRIRLHKPSALPPQHHGPPQATRQALSQPPPPLPPPGFTPNHFTPSESPLTNFQRIVGFSPPLQPSVFSPPPPLPAPLPQTPAEPIQPHLQPPSLPSDAPQRQSFRRIKPSSGGTRRIKIKTSSPLLAVPIAPSRVAELNSRRVTSSATPPLPPNSARLRGRGPISAQDEDLLHKDNALDNEDDNGINGENSSQYFGNRVAGSTEAAPADDNGILLIGSLSRSPVTSTFAPVRTSHQPQVHTPTIPLTYYTTYTYFTTVLRGPHTAMLSRELVSTTTAVRPIDRSIVTAIEFSEGYIQPSKTLVALGTKTKGQTTTIYNMASRVQVFNDDLYKVIYATRSRPAQDEQSSSAVPPHSSRVVVSSRVPSRVSSSVHRIEPSRSLNRPSPQSRVVTPSPPARTSSLKFDELDKLPKKLLNKYTYYYTFIDGPNTRYSTRMEESSTHFAGNLANLAPSLAPSLDSDGLLQILSTKSATMPLGSRAHGRMTTVVNLALNNYIQFDNTPRESSSRIRPTQVASNVATLQTQTPSLISSSFEDSSVLLSSSPDRTSEQPSAVETPRLSSEVVRSSEPVSSSTGPVSSRILLTSSSVRTRPAVSRRPIRVKVKPIRSKLATLSRFSSRVSISSSVVEPSPSFTELYSSSSVPQSSSSSALPPSPSPVFIPPSSSTELPVSPTAPSSEVLSTVSNESILSTPSVTRKKVVYTVRSRLASGSNRYFRGRPSSYLFQRSSVLVSSPVPDSSSSVPMLTTPLYSSSSVMSSAVQPTFTLTTVTSSPEVTYSPSAIYSSELESSSPLPSTSTPELVSSPVLKPTKPSKSRFVVLTRLAGALNKWNPLHASRIRVSSRKVFKSTGLADLSSMMLPIEPTSRVETVFETTTHTVPFTLGSTTIFTTVEETNSRVITRLEESPMESSSISSSFAPSESPVIASSTIDPSKPAPSSSTVSFETKTQLTTLTHFNTIYKSDSSIVTSSEQTLSSVFTVPKLAPVSSTVVVETSDLVTTSTLYSTYTYFATLFNGSQTMITPLEEVKTEYLTLREPVLITRTIMPSMDLFAASPSSTVEVKPTSIMSSPNTDSSMNLVEPMYVTETQSTFTTLTHFITLFSGTRTILSSIEEVSPTVVTKTRVVIPTTTASSMMSSSSSSTTSESPMLSPTILEIASEPIFSSSVQPVYSSSVDSSIRSSSIQMMPEPSPSVIEPSEMFMSTSTHNGESSTTSTMSLESVLFMPDQIDKDLSSEMSVMMGPSTTLLNEQHSSSTTAVIEPGSVIELNDLLDGVQDAGQIGEAIKDIVNNMVTRPDTAGVMAEKEQPTTPMSIDEETTPDSATDAPVTSFVMNEAVTTIAPSFNPSSTSEKTTPSLNSIKNRFPVYIASQNLPKYYMSSSTDDKSNQVIFSTQSEGNEPEPSVSTRYVTSIEKSIKTLTLTSTKVYYTRDSPLTITNILTTTLPAITYVSTIIGSKTILGTYNSISPTRSSTMVTETPVSSSTVVVTSSMPMAPTTRPRLHRPKNQEPPTLLKAKVTPFLNSRKVASKPSQTSRPVLTRNMTLEAELCTPACNLTNKEYCREGDSGKYSCECRPGYVRRPSDSVCQEIKNYLVTVRVSKTAESEVAASSTGNEAAMMQSYARVARRISSKSDGIAGVQVLSVDREATQSNNAVATMVNLTVQLDHPLSNMHDDLSKQLQPLGQVEKVVDFDECSSPLHNDCSGRARCINEPGSYRCQCLENFIDLDQSLPGRLCVSEVKSCDYCYGRGDCWRQQSSTVCRCHPMFIGRRCEINGLLLAILVPIVAILVIVAIVCFLYCSRKLRQRNRRFKNLAAYGPVAVIGGTLDRKAMLETSSESSDPQHRSSHYNSESNPASARGSMARRNGTASRRESEPSLDRSLASYSATGSAYNSLPPQILIPRARPPYTLHPGQVYMW